MKKAICLFNVMLLFASCVNKQENVFTNFPEPAELKFISLHVDDLFYRPLSIEVFDSLLLVYDDTSENGIYHILNLNNKETEYAGGTRGSGPNELLFGAVIDKVDNDKFQVIDVSARKNLIFSISDILKQQILTPIKVTNYSEFDNESDRKLLNLYYINDSCYVGLGMFNEENEFTFSVCNDKLVVCYLYKKKFAIYTLCHNEIKLDCEFEFSDNKSKNEYFYTDVYCADTYIYLLSQCNVSDLDPKQTEIEIYTPGGEPVGKVQLGILAKSMLADVENDRILFFSPLNEDYIYYSRYISE